MLCVTSSLNHFRIGRRIHEDVDVLASVIFGVMAQSNLLVSTRSIHNWISFSVCQLSILTPFNKNFMIIFTQLLSTATLIVTGTCTTPTRAPFYRLYFLQSMKRVLHVTLPYNWRPSSMVEHFRGTNFPCIYHRKGFQCTDLKKNLVGRLECRYPDGNKIHSCRLHFSNGNSCTFCTLIWLDSYTSYARLKF